MSTEETTSEHMQTASGSRHAYTRLCIVGLGNPGVRYVRTRHNIGFQVVDMLADRLHVREFSFDVNYYAAETRIGDCDVLLCKPWTYMNLSGEAVAVLLDRWDFSPDELLIVYDDMHLPLGRLRLRPRGSHGGHNGIASVIETCGTEEFLRLRCGVDFSDDGADLADYVLSPFHEQEIKRAEEMIVRAGDAIGSLIADGLDKTMNIYNVTIKEDSI